MTNTTDIYHSISYNWSSISTYISIFCMLLIDTGAVVLNFLVISIIFKDPLLREKIDCIFIANLALADFLVALVIIPFTIASLIDREYRLTEATSSFIGFANFFFCIASIMTLMLLVLDQTCTITWPLRYERYRTRKLGMVASFCAWVYSSVCAIPPAIGLASYSCFIANIGPCSDYDWAGTNASIVFTIIVTAASWGVALLVTVVCYVQILTIVRKQQKSLAKQKPAAKRQMENVNDVSTAVELTQTSRPCRNVASRNVKRVAPAPSSGKTIAIVGDNACKSYNLIAAQLLAIKAQQEHLMDEALSTTSGLTKFKKERPIASRKRLWGPAKTLLLVICVYFFTWSPFCILLLVEIALERKLTSDFSLVFLWIGHSSCLLNPILYFLRYRKFRVLSVRLLSSIYHWFTNLLFR